MIIIWKHLKVNGTVKKYDYNVMIGGKIFATGQGDNNTAGCLLDDVYFKNNYKVIAIAFSKEQALDVDPKAIQQINFTGNLEWGGQTAMFFIIEEAKETILDFEPWKYYSFVLF